VPDKCRVMIVDDEKNFTESLQLAIEDQFHVSTVHTLEHARREIGKGTPDVILLDLRLPDGDGLELLREVKASSEPPIVLILTAFATIESFITAASLGAEDYVTKPLDVERLKMQIHKYVTARARG